jgi:hypothetical protein
MLQTGSHQKAVVASMAFDDESNPVFLPTFDLSYLHEQILKDNPELTAEKIDDYIRKYRNYLALCKMYPGVQLMPCPDIDLIWHQHLLNTKRYQEDCVEYFGWFLHHNPKMPTEEIARNSGELYVKHFGREIGYENRCIVMCCCSGDR